MGLKSHQMDVVIPARARGIPKACTREKGGCSTIGTLVGLYLRGSFPPTMTLALEGP
jgi:hypothetical protein